MENIKNYDSIINQIKKVKELAENGIDGEKENAKSLLEKLLKKHKVSLEELVDIQTKQYKFCYKTKFERSILFQCLAKYANINTYRNCLNNRGKLQKNTISVELTPLQFLDVSASSKYYVKLFTKEMDLFFTAFISKHHIFREKQDGDEENNKSVLTEEESMAIVNMMRAMKDDNYVPIRRQIETKK